MIVLGRSSLPATSSTRLKAGIPLASRYISTANVAELNTSNTPSFRVTMADFRVLSFLAQTQLNFQLSADMIIRLWDAATSMVLQTLEGHSGRVTSVAFSPDGLAVNTLLLSNGWIAEGGTNILWLPIDYRSPSCIVVWENLP